jgi:Hypervirulence associated proteins TUDOR domain
MADELTKGDRVEWNSSSGKIEGTVEKKITEPTDFKNHHFEASVENPQYLVKSEKTGEEAIHKLGSLKIKEN